jgi:hypothetical protein
VVDGSEDGVIDGAEIDEVVPWGKSMESEEDYPGATGKQEWKNRESKSGQIFPGNFPEIVSGNFPEIVSENFPEIVSANFPEIVLGNFPEIVSANFLEVL